MFRFTLLELEVYCIGSFIQFFSIVWKYSIKYIFELPIYIVDHVHMSSPKKNHLFYFGFLDQFYIQEYC